jgi:hypothetical protein
MRGARAMRDTTPVGLTRGTALGRRRQRTMAMGRRPRDIMDGRRLRSKRVRRRRLRLRRRGMGMIARRCGGCLGRWTKIVSEGWSEGGEEALTRNR